MSKKDWEKAHYESVIVKAQVYLGNECVECRSNDNLEFDHIDPKTKLFTITQRTHLSWDRLRVELDKCQLLCASCHKKKTSVDARARVTHGKYHVAYHLKCSCDLCIEFKKQYVISRRSPDSRRVQSRELVHGTRAGYLKEKRLKIETCILCRRANTDYTTTFRNKQSLNLTAG